MSRIIKLNRNFQVLVRGLILISFSCWWCGQMRGQTSFPRITQISPTFGEPGTVVMIQGTGFTGVSSVQFGVGGASFESISATQIRTVVPSDATTGAITVSTNHGFAVSNLFFQVAPRIESFEPVFGKVGDTILLKGANLSGLNSVQIGTFNAAFSAVSDAQLSFVIPSGATTGLIRLVSPAGRTDSESMLKVIGPEPFITSFEPSVAAPGTLVAIRGVQFSNATKVLFASDVEGSFSVVADTQILVRVPGGATSGPVAVTTSLGQGISEIDLLVTGTGPFISSLEPDHGQVGDTIVVSGVNLTEVTEVIVHEEVASFQVVADTQLSFVIPAGATSGAITLRSPESEFVFEPGVTVDGSGPVLESFSPSSGLPGDTIDLRGSHFRNVESVRFGDKEAAFMVTAETQMTASVPGGAETAPITIVTAFGETLSTVDFQVRQPAPELIGFEPGFGPIGTRITLQGTYLNSVTNVVVGGQNASFEIVADSQILTRVPDDARTDVISLQSFSGTTVSADLFFLPASIQSIVPAAAVPGTEVNILGTNFTGTTRVRFGGVEAEIASVELDSLKVLVPSAALIGPVAVTTPAGSIVSSSDFGVLPEVSGISPLAGPVGSLLQIQGRGFAEVTDVLVGLAGSEFEIISSEMIELKVPSNATSGWITVRNPSGQSASSEQFQIREAADLSLEVSLNNPTSSWLTPAQFTIKVHNAGPSPARNFFMRHQMPAGVVRLSGANSGGSTDVFGEVVLDGIVSIEAGESVLIQHVVSTPHYGFETHLFDLDTEIFDPTPNDQQVVFQRQILGPPVTLSVVRGVDGDLQLQWASALRGYLLHAKPALDVSIPWGPIETLPDSVGPWRRIPVDPHQTGAMEFFRLQAAE
jgi:hypothetical protein